MKPILLLDRIFLYYGYIFYNSLSLTLQWYPSIFCLLDLDLCLCLCAFFYISFVLNILIS